MGSIPPVRRGQHDYNKMPRPCWLMLATALGAIMITGGIALMMAVL